MEKLSVRTWRKFSVRCKPAMLTLCLMGASAGYSAPVQADALTARQNFFINLARAGSSLGVNEAATRTQPTLIRGMYVLTTADGKFMGFINEPGTLFGDFRGLNVFSPKGGPQRPLSREEAAGLRAEIMASFDYDQLIKITHGDGGGRRLLMLSAIDCPYCKKLEDTFRESKKPVDTTFYVLPSSLQPIDKGGMQPWQAVSRIWCAENNASAWNGYWKDKKLPAQRECAFDAQNAAKQRRYVVEILRATGLDIHGTPAIVREDGSIVPLSTYSDPTTRAATYGPAGNPQLQVTPHWLASAAADAGSDAAVAASTAPAAGQQSTGKVNLKDALNKLFK